jgi:hypothetical protein
VSFYTIIDTQIIYKSVKVNEYTGRLGLPVNLTLNVTGVIAPLKDLVDLQVSVHRGSMEGVIERFKAPGEQICGFQYRKVCYR